MLCSAGGLGCANARDSGSLTSGLYLQEYDELAEAQVKLEEKLQELEANPPRSGQHGLLGSLGLSLGLSLGVSLWGFPLTFWIGLRE